MATTESHGNGAHRNSSYEDGDHDVNQSVNYNTSRDLSSSSGKTCAKSALSSPSRSARHSREGSDRECSTSKQDDPDRPLSTERSESNKHGHDSGRTLQEIRDKSNTSENDDGNENTKQSLTFVQNLHGSGSGKRSSENASDARENTSRRESDGRTRSSDSLHGTASAGQGLPENLSREGLTPRDGSSGAPRRESDSETDQRRSENEGCRDVSPVTSERDDKKRSINRTWSRTSSPSRSHTRSPSRSSSRSASRSASRSPSLSLSLSSFQHRLMNADRLAVNVADLFIEKQLDPVLLWDDAFRAVLHKSFDPCAVQDVIDVRFASYLRNFVEILDTQRMCCALPSLHLCLSLRKSVLVVHAVFVDSTWCLRKRLLGLQPVLKNDVKEAFYKVLDELKLLPTQHIASLTNDAEVQSLTKGVPFLYIVGEESCAYDAICAALFSALGPNAGCISGEVSSADLPFSLIKAALRAADCELSDGKSSVERERLLKSTSRCARGVPGPHWAVVPGVLRSSLRVVASSRATAQVHDAPKEDLSAIKCCVEELAAITRPLGALLERLAECTAPNAAAVLLYLASWYRTEFQPQSASAQLVLDVLRQHVDDFLCARAPAPGLLYSTRRIVGLYREIAVALHPALRKMRFLSATNAGNDLRARTWDKIRQQCHGASLRITSKMGFGDEKQYGDSNMQVPTNGKSPESSKDEDPSVDAVLEELGWHDSARDVSENEDESTIENPNTKEESTTEAPNEVSYVPMKRSRFAERTCNDFLNARRKLARKNTSAQKDRFSDLAIEEISRFRNSAGLSLAAAPLDSVLNWWKTHEHEYPILQHVARSALGFPGSCFDSFHDAIAQTVNNGFLCNDVARKSALIHLWELEQQP